MEPGASPNAWTSRYEDLRRRVTEEGERLPRGPEITVFVRRGMVAWTQAWSEEVPGTTPPSVAPEPTRLPAGLYADVTRLLVNMVLDRRQEILT